MPNEPVDLMNDVIGAEVMLYVLAKTNMDTYAVQAFTSKNTDEGAITSFGDVCYEDDGGELIAKLAIGTAMAGPEMFSVAVVCPEEVLVLTAGMKDDGASVGLITREQLAEKLETIQASANEAGATMQNFLEEVGDTVVKSDTLWNTFGGDHLDGECEEFSDDVVVN